MEITEQNLTNFATCWEVSQICKRMSKIGGVPSPAKNWGAKMPIL